MVMEASWKAFPSRTSPTSPTWVLQASQPPRESWYPAPPAPPLGWGLGCGPLSVGVGVGVGWESVSQFNLTIDPLCAGHMAEPASAYPPSQSLGIWSMPAISTNTFPAQLGRKSDSTHRWECARHGRVWVRPVPAESEPHRARQSSHNPNPSLPLRGPPTALHYPKCLHRSMFVSLLTAPTIREQLL